MVVERGALDRRAERRRTERERRSRFRRRRLTALVAVIAIVVVAVVAIGKLGGSSGDKTGDPTRAAAGKQGGGGAGSPAHITGPTVTGSAAQALKVPILEYHSISIPPSGASLPELFTSTGDFTDQLKYLKSQGYDAITMDELFAGWAGKAPLPEKPVVVSMDDGYLTQYTHALPVLKSLGWPGVLNLKLLSLQQQKPELTSKMIREMIAAGWEIDDHTVTHPDVTTLSASSLETEVGASRKTLQKEFGIPVNFFCYPAGKFNDSVIAALKRDGYTGATTEIGGFASRSGDPFKLPRIEIEGSDGIDGFKQKLAAAGA